MKTLLKILAGLALAAVLLVAVLYLARNAIATAVVRAAANAALGVPVKVEAVEIEPFAGSATVRGLEVGNPSGYASPTALSAGDITVDLSADSSSTSVVVDMVHLRDVGIWFEQKGTTNNVSDIIGGMSSKDAAAPKAPAAKGPGIELVIRTLLLEKVAVHAAEGTGLVGKAIPLALTLDRLEIKDIRTTANGDGVAEQVTAKVFEATMAAVVRESGSKLPAQLGASVLDSAKAAGTVVEGATKAIGEATKGLGDTVKGLGDAFGGGKKK
jgi:hypothetical protein